MRLVRAWLPALLVVSLSACTLPPSYRPGAFTPAGHRDWPTAIPADLRVDGHLPEGGGDFRRTRDGVTGRFCGRPGFPPVGLLDRRTASATGPEYGEARDLRLLRDDRAAHRFLRRVHAVVEACVLDEAHQTSWRTVVRPSTLEADEAFTVVRSWYEYDGRPVLGGSFWEVARVGNAVLLTASHGEYEPTTTLGPGIRAHAADLTGILDSMRLFTRR